MSDRGPSLVGSLRAPPPAGTRDFGPTLAALVSPVQNIFSSTHTISIHLSPFAQQAGQTVVPRRLSINMYLCGEVISPKIYPPQRSPVSRTNV